MRTPTYVLISASSSRSAQHLGDISAQALPLGPSGGRNPLSHRGMGHFGQLVQKLRTERGLTQSDLASRAGVSDATIQRAEQTESCPWRRSTAREIFQVLNSVAAVEPASAAEYFKATGLAAGLAAAGEWAKSSEGQQTQAFVAFVNQLSDPRERQAYMWLTDLIDAVGVERLLDTLRGVAAMAGVELLPLVDDRGRTVRVHEPPVQREGYTEEIIRDVEVRPGAKPKAKPLDNRRA